MTPYAVLLVRSVDTDDVIRAAFHQLSKAEHPDRPGGNGQPGPNWYALANAYSLLRTADGRALWYANQRKLSRLCKTCSGYGVQGTRVLGRKIMKCAACDGLGRVK